MTKGKTEYLIDEEGIAREYPFFDGNALDAARFILGADCEEVMVHDDGMTIDEEIDAASCF